MKKVLLVYNIATRKELNKISSLLSSQLQALGYPSEIETCSLVLLSTEKLKKYDFLAGYKIDIQHELAISQAFDGRYLHFFENKYAFAFANVSKTEDMGGYNTYKVSAATC